MLPLGVLRVGWALSLFAVAACGEASFTVALRTDYAPGDDFDAVVVLLDRGAPRRVAVTRTQRFEPASRVVTISDVDEGRHRIDVELRAGDALVDMASVAADVSDGEEIVVSILRACVGGACQDGGVQLDAGALDATPRGDAPVNEEAGMSSEAGADATTSTGDAAVTDVAAPPGDASAADAAGAPVVACPVNCECHEPCSFDCDVGGCRPARCTDTTCSGRCTNPNCRFICEGARCDVACDGECGVECRQGSSCAVACRGPGCRVQCRSDAECVVDCGPTTECVVDCDVGSRVSCSGACTVDDACRPPDAAL